MEKNRPHSRNAAQEVDARVGAQVKAPVEGYDEISVDEAKERLEGLSKGELEGVRSYERENKGRKTLVSWLDARIED